MLLRKASAPRVPDQAAIYPQRLEALIVPRRCGHVKKKPVYLWRVTVVQSWHEKETRSGGWLM